MSSLSSPEVEMVAEANGKASGVKAPGGRALAAGATESALTKPAGTGHDSSLYRFDGLVKFGPR